MRLVTYLLIAHLLSALPTVVSGHSGGLDAAGGHYNRKTGEYHCHRAPCVADRAQPDEIAGPYVRLYERSDWRHWIDEDSDCQDTRAEVLISESLASVQFRNQSTCVVDSGLWIDSYTGVQHSEASEMDIDHIVPLAWAHGHGGDAWNASQKETFANDTENLTVVHASTNRAKGSQGPDDWLPTNPYRCEYLRTFFSVVKKYDLKFVENENVKIRGQNNNCL